MRLVESAAATTQSTLAVKALSLPDGVIQTILGAFVAALEKRIDAYFDEHREDVLFKHKILFWSVTIKLKDIEPQIRALLEEKMNIPEISVG